MADGSPVSSHGGDKIVGNRRRILWRIDAMDTLRAFARRCALDVIHLWDAPDVVRRYLETGDEALRVAATVSAARAAWTYTRADARDAARSARYAARFAASDAAKYTAKSAAKATAWATARVAQNDTLTRMVMEARG